MACSERYQIFICALIFISLAIIAGCTGEPALQVGDTAEDFTLTSLAGEEITLSQLRGKNVLILFWVMSCPFCRTDNILRLNDIYLKGKKAGLEILAVNIAEPLGDARTFVKRKGLIFPVLLDRNARVTREKYGVYVVPTLCIVGKNGVIKEKAYGYLSEDGLMDFVKPYILRENPEPGSGEMMP